MKILTQLPPEVAQSIALRNNEKILFARSPSSCNPPGGIGLNPRYYFVITGERFLFIKRVEKGRHDVLHSIDFERIQATSTHTIPISQMVLSVSWDGEDRRVQSAEIVWKNKEESATPEAIKNFVDDLIKRRAREIEEERKRERVQFVIDFSFLKAQIERGGLVLSTVKCPNCMGPLTLPDSGNITNCGHCGATIRAVGVFDKLKVLFGA
jgi:ribosomal protein S27AE